MSAAPRDKHLDRIAALLRQAERTDNEHEADAFMAAAQRLATVASIDLALARKHTAQRERRATPVARTIEIGQPGRRGLATYVELFCAIAAANDIRCDVARNSTFVIAYGFEHDIEVVQALYASLVVQMVRASDTYLRSGEHRAESVVTVTRTRTGRVRRVTRPVHGTTARLSFHLAFADRIRQRLAEAREAAAADTAAADTGADAAPGAQSARTAGQLVLVEKGVEISDFYARNSTARGTWRGSSVDPTASRSAARAGTTAADRARLAASRELGGHRRAVER